MRSPLPKTGTWDCARQTSDQAAGNPVPVVSYSFAGMQPNLPREWTEVGPENFCFQSGVANPHIAALLITIQSSGTMPGDTFAGTFSADYAGDAANGRTGTLHLEGAFSGTVP